MGLKAKIICYLLYLKLGFEQEKLKPTPSHPFPPWHLVLQIRGCCVRQLPHAVPAGSGGRAELGLPGSAQL